MGAPRSSSHDHDDLKSVDLMMSSGQQADAKALILQRMLEEFDQAGFRATPPPSVSRSHLPAVEAAPAPSEAIETLDLLMNEFLDDTANNNAVNVNTDSYSNDLSFTSSSRAGMMAGYDPMDATQTTPEPPPAPFLASFGSLGPLPYTPPPSPPPPPPPSTRPFLSYILTLH
eukprot:TRINITY_DN4887_c0_g1_i2.p1 TRINITY_DN4887_c0_g1~~TRINITY_DN4887_c0_g1_i2.p1  ORF type:complete len:180 (+),score=49.18 TRINITY_DN4887_c0_g1_i2:27-542(+)